MTARRHLVPLLLATLTLPLASALPAGAQTAPATPIPGWQATPWADSVMIQTQLFFSLATGDGKGVSEQQFAQFLEEVVRPRFSDGMTVLDAYGQGKGTNVDPVAMLHAGTKMLILVHPNTPDAQSKLGEIKAQFRTRFGGTNVFHLDFPVRIGG
ncbi:DUF3574 domain-containing protein [Azorhizobium sp. AG788]|uniref:DUF3574 domain-containing protein n=1 Tax=Azorhizobium sp. AG788 TaxID=2183897 RepID=UPI003139B968